MAINTYGTLFKVEHFQMVNASLSFALTKTTPKVINFNFSLFQPRMRLGGLCAAHIWNRIKLPQVVYTFVKFRGSIQRSKVFQVLSKAEKGGTQSDKGLLLSLLSGEYALFQNLRMEQAVTTRPAPLPLLPVTTAIIIIGATTAIKLTTTTITTAAS